jgi:methylmalonyl-CoA mutase C-terminal domain/subunit
LEELVVFGGGIIPDQDIEGLKKIGVKEIFGPGTTTVEMIDWINDNVNPKE